MAFSRTKLARYIADSADSKQASVDLAKDVAAYLIDTGKTAELNSLLRDVAEERAVSNGFLEVTAISAFELNDAEKQEIEKVALSQYPRVKKVVIRSEIDESAVGGVKLLLPHYQLDLSIRTKLNRLANAC